jgi:hypothetical protein
VTVVLCGGGGSGGGGSGGGGRVALAFNVDGWMDRCVISELS